MGAWSRALLKMRLIFVGNGSDQIGSADMVKQHVTCRPQHTLQALWVIGLEREVLIEI